MAPLGIITNEDYLMGRDVEYPLSADLQANAEDIVAKLNQLEIASKRSFFISSGYRPPAINAEIPGAVAGDAHEKCCGVDLRDFSQELYNWCVQNLETLVAIGFWMESIVSAKDHVHLQTYAPKSGNRIFIA
jgi:hypothetical protein